MFEEKGKKDVRRWSCFVCGELFPTYDDYKSHIYDKHEEGREWIKCPGCEAPVRDMKAHYKAKHPNRVLPTNVQHTVTVWFDFDSKGKRKARRPKVRDGTYMSKKMNAPLHYRSGYECEVYELLDDDQDVQAYYVEPFKVPYNFQGEWHDYIPDLKVCFVDGRIEVWEIKPATQTGLDKNKAKWASMDTHANNLGWKFMVLTEVGINKLKTKLKRQLNEGQ